MNKVLLRQVYAFIAVLFMITSCDTATTDITPVVPTDPLPAATGTLDVTFTNFDNTKNPLTVDAKSGDLITASVLVKKAGDGSKPRTLDVYGAYSTDVRGTKIFDTISLRNKDEQTKTIEYTVSPTSGKVYLYFEVTDNNGKITRRTLIVNVVSEEQVTNWKDITLGAQSNALGSRVSSLTGDVYKVCDLQENMAYVDITYAVDRTTLKPTFLSNPQRAIAGFSTTIPATNTECGGESTAGGTPTYFIEAPNTVLFAGIDSKGLDALTVSNTSPQQIVAVQGKIYAFLNSKGKKGLIKVNEVIQGVDGKISFDIVVQK